jgi:hypothetical protein
VNLPAVRKRVIDLVPEDRQRDRALRAWKIREGMQRRYVQGQQLGIGLLWGMWLALHTGALIYDRSIEFEASWWGAGGGLLMTALAVWTWLRGRREHREYLEELGIEE